MCNLCRKGDIIILKHMQLVRYGKDPTLDTRLNGHPYIVLNDVTSFGEYVLCLKCSSSKKGKRKNCNYLIKNFKLNGHPKKDTYVDITNVYKIKIDNFIEPKGRISNDLLNELITLTQDLIHN